MSSLGFSPLFLPSCLFVCFSDSIFHFKISFLSTYSYFICTYLLHGFVFLSKKTYACIQLFEYSQHAYFEVCLGSVDWHSLDGEQHLKFNRSICWDPTKEFSHRLNQTACSRMAITALFLLVGMGGDLVVPASGKGSKIWGYTVWNVCSSYKLRTRRTYSKTGRCQKHSADK